MYEAFFDLNARPFPAAPSTKCFFPGGETEIARQTLTRCVERAEGAGLLIGGAGLGKSLVCQLLAERFAEQYNVVMLHTARLCTRRALLQNILFELRLPYRSLEEGELRLSLIDFLEPGNSEQDGMLLIVDEAHSLPYRLLEEIRMITNLVRNGQPRVRLIMAGTPALEERLANPKLEILNQRVSARCYLQPLGYEETMQYVRSHLGRVVDEPDRILVGDAYQAVFHASGGVPRLINQVCDHALVLAANEQCREVDQRRIEQAWADLQQLPTTWEDTTQQPRKEDSIVEFGSLDPAPSVPAPVEASASEAATRTTPLSSRDIVDLDEQLDGIELRIAELESAENGLCASDVVDEVESVPEATINDDTQPITAAEETVPQERTAVTDRDDPFHEFYAEEEVIVDHYASLDAERLTSKPVAVIMTDEELTTIVNTIFCSPEPSEPSLGPIDHEEPNASLADEEDDAEEVCILPVGQADPDEETTLLAAFPADDEASHDDVPDQPLGEAKASVVRIPPPDDNDMIVVIDEPRSSNPTLDSQDSGPRQEYGQLFSRLRQS